jgi:chemotaxis response regulator CheB
VDNLSKSAKFLAACLRLFSQFLCQFLTFLGEFVLAVGAARAAKRNKRAERAKNEVARQAAPKNEENVKTKESPSKIEPSLKDEDAEEKHSFPVVGVGASAGGLEAYNELLENLPLNTGMAFVLIQHLMSGQESMREGRKEERGP